MAQVGARIHDGDDGVGITGLDIPGLGCIDVGVGRTGGAVHRLPGVQQPPEGRKARIVGDRRGLLDPVRLGELHRRVALELADRLRDRASVCDLDELEPLRAEALGRLRAGVVADRLALTAACGAVELDDHLAGHVWIGSLRLRGSSEQHEGSRHPDCTLDRPPWHVPWMIPRKRGLSAPSSSTLYPASAGWRC
jgi:hypothetical protein